MLTALLASISGALSAFTEASKDFRDFLAWYKQGQALKWQLDLAKETKDATNATTPEEQINAIKELQDLLRRS
jgi:hypothetical protein